MITTAPAASFEATADQAPTGLVGTIGLRIMDGQGNTVVARSTTGIVESPAGSGIYTATRTAPSTKGSYVIAWDTGGVTPKWTSEELVVGYSTPVVFGLGYSTPADVRQVLAPDGHQDASTAASLDDDDILREIVNAQSEVDGRLRSRYSVPFAEDEVPPLVKTMTTDIAAYLVMLVHSRGKPVDLDHPVRLRYTRAKDNLTAISKGQMELLTPDGDGLSDSAEAAVVNPYEGEMFPMEDHALHDGPAHPASYRPYG